MDVAILADLGVERHGQKQATRSVGLLLILLQPRERAEGAQGLVGGGSDLCLASRLTIRRDRWGSAATQLPSGPAAKVAPRLARRPNPARENDPNPFRTGLYLKNQEYQAGLGFLAGMLFLLWKVWKSLG